MIEHDGISVDPQGLSNQLWEALAALICDHSTPEDPEPCRACLRLTKPILLPFARALMIAGKRPDNNYILTGRGAEYFIKIAFGELEGDSETLKKFIKEREG